MATTCASRPSSNAGRASDPLIKPRAHPAPVLFTARANDTFRPKNIIRVSARTLKFRKQCSPKILETNTMRKIVANPFQAGGKLRDTRHFVGRESEIRQILSRVANMDSVSVIGPRRIGKSSLLHHIVASGQQRLNESYHFHYLDLQPLDSAEEFYNLACEVIA